MAYKSLDEFWPFYVSQHSREATRRLHFAGTTAGLICLGLGAAWADPRPLAAGLLASYGLAWTGHFFVEKNRPATFAYPLLSFRADFRMYALMWRGTMDDEIARLKNEAP